MATVFITGMSGTGKSTVLVELSRRGLQVVDTDGATLELDTQSSVEHVADVIVGLADSPQPRAT